MKKYGFLIFVLSFFFNLTMGAKGFAEATIAFVHIGSSIPNYTILALKQARLLNESGHIVLIAEQSAANSYATQLEALQVELVPIASLQRLTEHQQFLDRTIHDYFWRVTIERFFYLGAWMESYGVTDVFHLENDNMLYVDVNELLPIFKQHYPGLAVTFDNDNRGIAGLMYISSAKALRVFLQYIVDEAPSSFNDMQLLASFRKHVGINCIDHLPIVMSEYKDFHPLRTLWGGAVTTQQPDAYSRHFDLFQSLFDAAALGQYLGGTSCDSPGFVNEACLFNPSKMLFEWEVDTKGRKIPFAQFGTKRYRINNLHLHRKWLENFASDAPYEIPLFMRY